MFIIYHDSTIFCGICNYYADMFVGNFIRKYFLKNAAVILYKCDRNNLNV